ncbi:hypothetical protein B0H15DRAFT_944306 [Mycena belliarum]|uniref:Uncharacterized protein n=1 Tax=Mycena belliarum TaxID=1033014 RepID=A0AAD6UEE6_9AGAR|nr:hypothetical protein B0H15DRAFT_944306 [Mycena belliae]
MCRLVRLRHRPAAPPCACRCLIACSRRISACRRLVVRARRTPTRCRLVHIPRTPRSPPLHRLALTAASLLVPTCRRPAFCPCTPHSFVPAAPPLVAALSSFPAPPLAAAAPPCARCRPVARPRLFVPAAPPLVAALFSFPAPPLVAAAPPCARCRPALRLLPPRPSSLHSARSSPPHPHSPPPRHSCSPHPCLLPPPLCPAHPLALMLLVTAARPRRLCAPSLPRPSLHCGPP